MDAGRDCHVVVLATDLGQGRYVLEGYRNGEELAYVTGPSRLQGDSEAAVMGGGVEAIKMTVRIDKHARADSSDE
jgi:hypothetical protein